MILFAQLLLAHLLGDFVLQPNHWVADKMQQKIKSIYLYAHILLHGLLAWLVSWSWKFAGYALLLALLHGLIDLLKLYLQKPKTQRYWLLGDQALHLISIAFIVLLYEQVDLKLYTLDERLWLYASGVLFLTTPTSILIKNIISIWTPNEPDTNDQPTDLQNAGKYIGILERLFVYFFVVSGYFASIGFLMAAKSIFRFGDLTQAKDRRLTEYVLIGTLISFGFSIAVGYLTQIFLPYFS